MIHLILLINLVVLFLTIVYKCP